jgi:hypothetical protein
VRALVFTLVLLAPHAAAADAGDTARSVGEAVGYTTPAIGAALTTIANGTALAYGEASPRGWRVAGWILGGVEVAIGTGLLYWRHDGSVEIGLGVLPVVLGVASLTTATLVDSEEVPGQPMAVVPWVASGAGGIGIGGRF